MTRALVMSDYADPDTEIERLRAELAVALANLSTVRERAAALELEIVGPDHNPADCHWEGGVWWSENDLWLEVMGTYDALCCQSCFAKVAAQKGIGVEFLAVRRQGDEAVRFGYENWPHGTPELGTERWEAREGWLADVGSPPVRSALAALEGKPNKEENGG